MKKIRNVCMTLALAGLLTGMTACGNNTTNDNGNVNTESNMGQTDTGNGAATNPTEMPANDNVNDVTEGTDGNTNRNRNTNNTNTGDGNTLGDDVGDAAEDVTRGVGEGVEDVGRAVDDVVSGGDPETQNPQENGATTQNGAGMAQ